MSEKELSKKKRWMIFRTEVSFVYYIWSDGMPFPALFSLPAETNPESYYWMGNPAKPLPNQERQILEEFSHTKKIVMTFPGRSKQRFIIEHRGDINEE